MAKAKTIAEAEGIDEKEMEGLSDIEREALMEDPAADEAALKEIAGEADDEGEEVDDKAKGKKGADAKDDDGKKSEAEEGKDEDEESEDDEEEEADEGEEEEDESGEEEEEEEAAKGDEKEEKETVQADADDEDDEPAAFIPRLKVEPVEGYDKKMADLAAKKNAVHQKFKAGEIELDQMLTERDEVDTEAGKLRMQQERAEHNAAINQQNEAAAWHHDISTFVSGVKKAEGIDYGKKTLNAALDEAVKELANAKDKDGKLLHAEKSGRWFLREAHKRVKEDLGIKPAVAAEKGDDKAAAEKKAAALAARKPDKKKVPKTLAGLPGASADDTKGDPEFQHLDKLDGMDLEYAVAKMTPEQQERWARSTH
jgi:hypothetical protein